MGAEAAIDLYRTLSAQEIDGLIFVLNQYRADPEERMQDYLKRCYEQWRSDNEAARLAALGITPDTTVIEG